MIGRGGTMNWMGHPKETGMSRLEMIGIIKYWLERVMPWSLSASDKVKLKRDLARLEKEAENEKAIRG